MTPAEQAASLQVGDVIRRGTVVWRLTLPSYVQWANHLVASGRWVKVDNEGGA